ncbi:MAG: STAS domain-containing protein [Gammaproteobacteria bacterium]|nr:STAS domain-containing protein [Gammaproteobacteria bacterium]
MNQSSENKPDSIATLRLSGRFDFNCFKSFQNQYEPHLADPQVETIDINMAGVSYLDSSALGMLMLLREKAETAGKRVRIAQCQGMARDILDLANFHKRFEFV